MKSIITLLNKIWDYSFFTEIDPERIQINSDLLGFTIKMPLKQNTIPTVC